MSVMVTETGTLPKLREDLKEFRVETESIFDVVGPTCKSVNQLVAVALPLNRCLSPAWRAITPFKAS